MYGISVDSLLHQALIKNQIEYAQTDQVKDAFAPSYSSLFHLPVFNELVTETSTSFQESETNYLPHWAAVQNSGSHNTKQAVWRKELERSRQIDLSLSVKDIIFPFHSFS
ncbi:hypothetical protein MB14_05365 [Roseivirga ehrenbergii]|uniref:Uncharacterized protein n=1 Tax=Roseivirga ehrenbergii (strain DSM 102268 / JCM 13514 / KCTC 12282 / NCIMB 14502 / KMM 6017) TaxID=279360 RepID=A0A150X7B7_ROSEK|nr:hypothetical protein MB14_05365 [Roseivirga ehrenbergii]